MTRARQVELSIREAVRVGGYANEAELFKHLYEVKGHGVDTIARLLFIPTSLVRKRLLKYNIPLKSPGGNHNQKIVVTEALIAEVRRDGMGTAAIRLGVDTLTLTQAINRFLRRPPEEPLI